MIDIAALLNLMQQLMIMHALLYSSTPARGCRAYSTGTSSCDYMHIASRVLFVHNSVYTL